MIKPLLHALSPGGPQARLSILIFHRVLPQPDPLFPCEVDATRFDAVCRWLKTWFNVLPLDTAVQRLQDGTLPPRSLSVTFDDGYADNHQVALPILLKHGLTATFFIATGFLDGGRMWNDTVIEAVRRAADARLNLKGLPNADLGEHPVLTASDKQEAIGDLLRRLKYLPLAQRQALVDGIAAQARADLPDNLMMTSEQVRSMRQAGMQIGAHTISHPILERLDAATAQREIESSKAELEALLDAPVDLFAYPNGRPGDDYTEIHVGMVRRAGFRAAVSTAWGASCSQSDLFQLPRFTPWERSRLRFAARLAANLWRSQSVWPATQLPTG